MGQLVVDVIELVWPFHILNPNKKRIDVMKMLHHRTVAWPWYSTNLLVRHLHSEMHILQQVALFYCILMRYEIKFIFKVNGFDFLVIKFDFFYAYPSLGNIIFHFPSLSLGLLSAVDNFFSLKEKWNRFFLDSSE